MKMKKIAYIILFMVSGLAILSCETKIDPALEKVDPVLVVDAWLTNKPGNQTIILSQTQPYFDATTPPPVTGAIVTIADNNNKLFSFNEDVAKPGYYVWKPVGNELIGVVGNSYKLSIQTSGENYSASSRMGPVPPIDTIKFKQNEPTQQNPDFYRGEFLAKDVIGKGDTYWIRTYKNGVLLNKPNEINIAYDAGFDAGGGFFSRIEKTKDGRDTAILVDFIPPIRGRINPNDTDANDKALSPYVPGDSAYVEIHSITVPAFNYLNEVSIQTNRPGGFSELFARPINNVSTNIVNANPSGKKAIGFFNVAAVSGKGQKFVKK
jgi:copper chaperone CopZ